MVTTSTEPPPTAPLLSPRPPRPPRTRRAGGLTRSSAPFWLLTPAGLMIVFVTLLPIGFLIFTSFTNYNQRTLFTGAFEFVGLDQYAAVMADREFWLSLTRTMIFTAALVVGSVAIGAGMSHLMTRLPSAIRHLTTVVLILAWAMPNVASSIVWSWLFQPQYGVINWMLTQLGVFGDMTSRDWASDPVLVWVCIWLLVVWQAVPFIALTLYAAETQVAVELKEAARLDGASEWHVYRVVVLPSIAPTILLVTMLSIIWDFNVFNQIWLISEGGPDGATSTLGVFTYTTAFSGNLQIGAGSAIAVASTIILAALSAVYIRHLVRSGEDL
ncbi:MULTISPECIES: carbohydrate ABC transporter permease [unclassified Microbacterium]|uniref:carbohydrate ABC transporter permease n=1 Tax=unclassified Microbacterium TaxID=2609290 RepID=UPI001BE5F424|nr:MULTISPECIES: sugar ABC transporter permease [unclassified Microbacterium]MBT2484441.1 sugar ABC transporter permease [Microbacterium sp. ISL-108]